MEQIEFQAMSVVQHKITMGRMAAYALGGQPAQDRVPAAPGGKSKKERDQAQKELALSQLFALQRDIGQASQVGVREDLQAKRKAADVSSAATPPDPEAVARMKAQLDALKKPKE